MENGEEDRSCWLNSFASIDSLKKEKKKENMHINLHFCFVYNLLEKKRVWVGKILKNLLLDFWTTSVKIEQVGKVEEENKEESKEKVVFEKTEMTLRFSFVFLKKEILF